MRKLRDKMIEIDVMNAIYFSEGVTLGKGVGRLVRKISGMSNKVKRLIDKLPELALTVSRVMQRLDINTGAGYDFDIAWKGQEFNVLLFMDYGKLDRKLLPEITKQLKVKLSKISRGVEVKINRVGIIEVGMRFALKKKL